MGPGTRTSPLHSLHEDRGARFTEFGGWNMPVQFESIRREHAAVRESAGTFDVSHMGQIAVAGRDATTLMNRLTTNDVTRLEPGDAQYAAITDEEGIMLDDTVVYRLPPETSIGDEGGDPGYLFVPNAGNDGGLTDRWKRHRKAWGLDAEIQNATGDWAMIAVQGPDAVERVAAVAREDVTTLDRFEIGATTIEDVECLIARTGYTGEDGFEVLAPWDDADAVWRAIETQPCGLGARDTLRIEAGFLLSGQDFDPDTEPRTPSEAGIDFAVSLDTEFVGREALDRRRTAGFDERFTGIRLLERGVPRNGYAIVDAIVDATADGNAGADAERQTVGHVTSGTMSPTLKEPIALGYVATDVAIGDRVGVRIRGETKAGEVVQPPFVERTV